MDSTRDRYNDKSNSSGGQGSDPSKICRDFLAGRCNRRTCKFSHAAEAPGNNDSSRQPRICQDFINGKCNRYSCKFSHESQEGGTPRPRGIRPDNNQSSGGCTYYTKGFCSIPGCTHSGNSYLRNDKSFGPPSFASANNDVDYRRPQKSSQWNAPQDSYGHNRSARQRSPMRSYGNPGPRPTKDINSECPNCLCFEEENVLLRRSLHELTDEFNALKQGRQSKPNGSFDSSFKSKPGYSDTTSISNVPSGGYRNTPYSGQPRPTGNVHANKPQEYSAGAMTNPYSAYNAYSSNYPSPAGQYQQKY
ncbi:hypothetical protein A3Q56_04058 [Intoshia linei]|uniref:C3H1-type domain-containing protein n=1 Tax=Intoshia linei TaxID=1819745 RepID=A0A177B1T4_9BILA|nr:hypothetical protein A3Q56_04058 [Intoshia linei]